MVQKQRDARLLRSLLRELPPPRGVKPTAWRVYVATKIQPRVELVLHDLGASLDGPTAKPEDFEPTTPRARREPSPGGKRRTITIREALALAIEQADPILGESLDERADALLVMALAAHPNLRSMPA